jgi:hypothetical protein
MISFLVAGQTIQLPAIPVTQQAESIENAWLDGEWLTVQLTKPVRGLRVHTDGKSFPGREASKAQGAWVAIGDSVLTSNEVVDQSALPGPFTHVSEAVIPAGCVVNVGINGPLFGGAGGGIQAQYVSGPPIEFTLLGGKTWMSKAGTA